MYKPFIVAEIGANHLGSFQRAKDLIIAAADCGADAVKLQTFDPDQMVGNKIYTLQNGPWKNRKLYDLYKECHTPREWHEALFTLADKNGITAFSTPFHPDDVEFLESIDCPIYKISSFEINYYDLIASAAETGKPLIISTGSATRDEIETACDVADNYHPNDELCEITLLKCTSEYPASVDDANLKTMLDYERFFGNIKYGISDHTQGISVPIAAAALGASVIEKHFTLDRSCGGPDSSFSLEPPEFAQMSKMCQEASRAIGAIEYGEGKHPYRRSLYYADNLAEGTLLTYDHIKIARPALGLGPVDIDRIVGRKLLSNVVAGDPIYE